MLVLAASIAALAPLGVQVLARGVVFIDLAVAQGAAAAALGISTVVDHPSSLTIHLAAAAGGLTVALLVARLVRVQPSQREALIGLVYVIGAAAAALGARLDPHGRDRLAQLLAADILWADAIQAATLGAMAVGAWLLHAVRRDGLWRDRLFYPVFAVIASLAVPVVGLFLVFAALIVPALWAMVGLPLALACLVAFAAAALGLAASWLLDWPSGSCVALALGLCGLAISLAPRGGDCRGPGSLRGCEAPPIMPGKEPPP